MYKEVSLIIGSFIPIYQSLVIFENIQLTPTGNGKAMKKNAYLQLGSF